MKSDAENKSAMARCRGLRDLGRAIRVPGVLSRCLFKSGLYLRGWSFAHSGQTTDGSVRGAGMCQNLLVFQALRPVPASESTVAAVGTGSYPPSCPGWHRPRRLNVMRMPLKMPCSRTASCAYIEHVGSYRHSEGRYGEIIFLYPCKNRITIRRI